jgi:superfamily II DNA or RNA helicase
MTFAIGSLVKARGREWVVLPESTDDLLMLRPLGGSEDEVTGVYLPLETVAPATFDLPDPARVGDYRSSRLLRDALRLGFRSSAGPFRSFGRLAFEPRPYQLVPLLMALKLDPVRLLIADDVGVGKTVEAGLIARELLDRGEVTRLAVLCPPQLAEQWQGELRGKFNLEAELVLPGTAARLERGLGLGQSLFDVYPLVIVSTDFIKSDRRRDEFLRTCPELVIVDEAHTCAFGAERGRHQRHELLKGLAKREDRHLILVTATPHSGKEEAFRSLLALLNPAFEDLPPELTGAAHERDRRRLAAQFVQRRRADIEHFMQADTPFPKRLEAEQTYKLSAGYKRLFERVLAYARESVRDVEGGHFRKRVRWWSALALLRSLASSPAAAAATLRTRAASADAGTPEAADEIGQRAVLDLVEADSAEGSDVAPGADVESAEGDGAPNTSRRRLLEMAREAEALAGADNGDEKLKTAVGLVKGLIKDGFNPIVFCRFIPTAEYVAAALRDGLPKKVLVEHVTGLLPPEDREARVAELTSDPERQRVLVCTDCLSEGINLQDGFDAVMHYDLSWNPTRHEQREGRVDRYGQRRPEVRTLLYYGVDNQIDGVVLDVLLRKHRSIRNSLGISVPVPADTSQVLEAVFEGLLLRESAGATAQLLPGFEAYMKPKKEELFGQWEAAQEREKRSRTMFAQEGIKVDEVARELNAAQAAVGSGVDVAGFAAEVVKAAGGVVSDLTPPAPGMNSALRLPLEGRGAKTVLRLDFAEAPLALRDLLRDHLDEQRRLEARFELPAGPGQVLLTRTHPVIEGLATHVLDTALDSQAAGAAIARRCGAIRTKQVSKRTTVLLVRARYHLVRMTGEDEYPLLAEECLTLAFVGAPEQAEWLDDPAAVESLLTATPDGNIASEQATSFVRRVIEGFEHLRPRLDQVVVERGEALLEAHRRVRSAARMTRVRYRVEAQVPGDLLGVFVYLPAAT